MRKLAFSILALTLTTPLWAKSKAISAKERDVIEQRLRLEGRDAQNPFVLSFYKPTYVLPVFYNFELPAVPNGAVISNDQNIKHTEFKFQFSFKVPLWRNVLGLPSSLYAAYTQSSFWQAYSDSPFFRESNYEPELFLANHLRIPLFAGWRAEFLNFGAVHQSNGRGGNAERSWNRLYLNAVFAKGNWAVDIKPWYVIKDTSLSLHNPDIKDYLGYGQLVVAYKYGENTFSLMNRNSLESGFSRGAVEASWSYPMLSKVKGYIQIFSGYGQSLIEYNQYANSLGMGIALSDWI